MIADFAIDEPEPDPPVDAPAAVDAPEPEIVSRLTAELIAVRDMLAVANARLAQYEQPSVDWKPLKLAAFTTGCPYETLRRWSRSGKIVSQKMEGRVFVDVDSIKARLNRFRV
jgi:hypothetical protein